MKSINKYRLIQLIILLPILLTCESKWFVDGVNCETCYTDKFTSAELEVRLSTQEQQDYTILEIFYGNLPDGELWLMDTVQDERVYLWVDVNKEYAARATYVYPNKQVIAIDGTKLRRRVVYDHCYETCYIVEDNIIDLKLADD